MSGGNNESWTTKKYNEYYNTYVPWLEDKYLAWFGENKTSYVAKDNLKKVNITGDKNIGHITDGLAEGVGGQLSSGGLLGGVGDLTSKEGMNRAERGDTGPVDMKKLEELDPKKAEEVKKQQGWSIPGVSSIPGASSVGGLFGGGKNYSTSILMEKWEAAAQIRADIEHGTTIVIDRYYYSGIVYSAVKLQPDLSLEWARKPEVGLPQPDIWFFLKIAPKNAAARGGFGAEKYENRKMQERVEEMFCQLSETSDGGDMRTIDVGRELNEVEDAIWGVVEATLRDPRMTEPLGLVGP